MKLFMLQTEIEPHLNAISDMLPSNYKLTLVARNTAMKDADIILTADNVDIILTTDNLDLVINSLEKLRDKN